MTSLGAVRSHLNHVVITIALTASGADVSMAQQGTLAPATPPADARPMSINLEDVPYPHPVSYLPLTLYG